MKFGRRKRVFFIVLSVMVATVGLATAIYMVSIKNIRAAYELEIDNYERMIKNNTHSVFTALTDIEAGEIITEEMLSANDMLCASSESMFSAEDIGKMALVDIPSGETMVKGFVSGIANGATEREVEYTCFYLPSSLEQGDFVDVRIRYSDGEDFVVLTKKKVEKISLASKSCFLAVAEDEIQMVASAIVDSNIYGAVLYTTVYMQPSAQPASAITYLPRSETLDVINIEEIYGSAYMDVLMLRGKLEQRLGNVSFDMDVSDFSPVTESEFSNVNGAGGSASGGIGQE